MIDIELIRTLSEELVLLRYLGHTGSETDALWARAKLRKPAKCVVTGIEMDKGEWAFRPVGNQDYRYQRIHPIVITELVKMEEGVTEINRI